MKNQKANKKKGQKFENYVQKSINSGALWFDKGDLKNEDYIIECKFTEKKSYRITAKLLEKLFEEACDANKLPRLVIGIEDEGHRWLLNVDISKEVK